MDRNLRTTFRPSSSHIWAGTIILLWFIVSIRLGQPMLAPHHSRALIAFGAFKGDSFTFWSIWRLVASQWLHVQFFHMLFNCLVIGVVGTALERGALIRATVPLGILGGAVGQFADAMTQPGAFISGASGASLTLVGAALLLLTGRSRGWYMALIGLAVALALDVRVSESGFVKAGHFVPLAVGILAGVLVRRPARARARSGRVA